MRAAIIDDAALHAISPVALAGFARAEGWSAVAPYGAHSDIYVAPDKPELLLPRTEQLTDYADVVGKLLRIFAEATGRDELSTYRDLSSADRDIVRVRVPTEQDDGSVPIDTGVEAFSNARHLLLAAACAAKGPQALFRSGSHREATNYIERVRLGQTEHGSFIVTLLAPVPPTLVAQQTMLWPDMEDEPFERQVTRCLSNALDALREAIELATSGRGEAFDHAVGRGVSANLCEAIVGLIGRASKTEISLSWATTRPTPEKSWRIAFSRADQEIIAEAAKSLRSRHPKADQSLVGTVQTTSRPYEEVEGRVTLRTVIDDRPQSVVAILSETDYRKASEANLERIPVLLRGDLERTGQRWRLANARLVTVIHDEEL